MQSAPEAGELPPPPPPPPSYQQYYQAYPPPFPPMPPPEPAPAAGGVPAFVWVGVGVLLALAWGKVSSFLSFFRGGAGAGGAGAQEKMMGWVRPLQGPCSLRRPGWSPAMHTCCCSSAPAHTAESRALQPEWTSQRAVLRSAQVGWPFLMEAGGLLCLVLSGPDVGDPLAVLYALMVYRVNASIQEPHAGLHTHHTFRLLRSNTQT